MVPFTYPYGIVPSFTPARGVQNNIIARRICRIAFRGSSQTDGPAVKQFPYHDIKPAGPLEPPVPEKFRIKGGENNRAEPITAEPLHLQFPAFREMVRMLNGPLHRHYPVIGELCISSSCDPVILHSGKKLQLTGMKKMIEIPGRKVKSDITVKIPVVWVPGIPLRCAPYLSG